MRNAHVYSVISRSVIRPVLAAAGCLIAVLAAATSPVLAQCITVNGERITEYNIAQRTKFNLVANHKSPPRQEIIDELIDDKLKIQTARRYTTDLTDKDVDAQYAAMANQMHLSPKELTQALNDGGFNAATIKAKILADMSWQYITHSKSPQIEADIGYDYTLRPILFIVPSGNAALLEERRKDADALRSRFANCEAGLTEARTQHDVVIRPPITMNSSNLAPTAREVLNKTELGHLTPSDTTAQGVQLFALCDKQKTSLTTYLRALRGHAKINITTVCLIRLR